MSQGGKVYKNETTVALSIKPESVCPFPAEAVQTRALSNGVGSQKKCTVACEAIQPVVYRTDTQ